MREETLRLRAATPPLLSWFDGHARTLPWRENPTPYRVWVSEIMLQQTRVEAVRPYFARFTAALPDVASLAACPQDRLLKLWEGLGYYNRARNMKRAAQCVMQQYGGEMPADYGALLALPGFGAYTAGAVASIAFGIPVPAVDGNVLRVYERLTKDKADIQKQATKRKVGERMRDVMPRDLAASFNQAWMELGATVCLPNGAPDCEHCPLAALCLAHRDGTEAQFPVRSAAKPRKIEERTVFVIRDGACVALCRRPNVGLLAGLYELPNVLGHLDRDQALRWLAGQNLSVLRILPLPAAKHVFTHIEWHMIGYAVRTDELLPQDRGQMLYVKPEQIRRDYPIPTAFSAYVDYAAGDALRFPEKSGD